MTKKLLSSERWHKHTIRSCSEEQRNRTNNRSNRHHRHRSVRTARSALRHTTALRPAIAPFAIVPGSRTRTGASARPSPVGRGPVGVRRILVRERLFALGEVGRVRGGLHVEVGGGDFGADADGLELGEVNKVSMRIGGGGKGERRVDEMEGRERRRRTVNGGLCVSAALRVYPIARSTVISYRSCSRTMNLFHPTTPHTTQVSFLPFSPIHT